MKSRQEFIVLTSLCPISSLSLVSRSKMTTRDVLLFNLRFLFTLFLVQVRLRHTESPDPAIQLAQTCHSTWLNRTFIVQAKYCNTIEHVIMGLLGRSALRVILMFEGSLREMCWLKYGVRHRGSIARSLVRRQETLYFIVRVLRSSRLRHELGGNLRRIVMSRLSHVRTLVRHT